MRWPFSKKTTLNHQPAFDALQNVALGLGQAGSDKSTGSTYGDSATLSQGEIDSIMRHNGIGRRIVNRIIDDAIRQGWEITFADLDGEQSAELLEKIHSWEARTKLIPRITQHLRQMRAFGGSILFAGIDDGDQAAPLENPSDFLYLRSYDRYEVKQSDIVIEDPRNPNFGEPASYELPNGTLVDASRVYRSSNESISQRIAEKNKLWGDSSLQPAVDSLKGFDTTAQTADHIAMQFLTVIYKFDALEMVRAAHTPEAIRDRVNSCEQTRSNFNFVVMDKTEDLQQNSAPLAGLPELMDRASIRLSAATSMPVTLLFGVSPGGFGTGDSEIKMWYDQVRSFTRDNLHPLLSWIYSILLRSPEFGYDGNFSITFNDLDAPTPLETAQLRQTVAQTDALYIQAGVVDPVEVANSRFSGDYSIETQLDETLRAQTAADPTETIEDPTSVANK